MNVRYVFRAALVLCGLAGSLVLAGCDLLGSDDDGDELTPSAVHVIVGNGGNFSDPDGFLTYYDPETQQASDRPGLGAFIQNMTLAGDSLYVVTNTTSGGRIEVFDAGSGNRTRQVVSAETPRALAMAGSDKAYVVNADYTGQPGTFSVYDASSGQLQEAVGEVGRVPEGIAVAAGKAFVANYGSGGVGTTLSVIDTAVDQVVGAVDLGCDGPNELFVDAQDELVVVCQGKTVYNEDFTEVVEQTNGQVVFVDPDAETVVDRIELDRQVGSANGTQGAYYAAPSEELYVIDGEDTVLRIDTEMNAEAGTVSVPSSTSWVGLTAVAYDAGAERLYLSRFAEGADGGPDYAAAGGVVVLNRRGAVETTFPVGPSPSHIVLRREEAE